MTAIRTITRLQDADDAPTLGAGQDGQVLAWDNGTGAFVAASAAGRVYDMVVDAAGDGDYTTLSAAVAAASAGDTIYVRNGTVAGGVTIDKALTIVGESRDGAVIQSPLSTTPAITVTGDDVVIDSVTIDGRRASQTGSGGAQDFAGVYNFGGLRMTLRGVRVTDTLGNGITVSSEGGADSVIDGCTVENIATNPAVAETDPVQVGIQVFGNASARVRITNNLVRGWSQGVGLWFGTNRCIVEGNTIRNNYGLSDGTTATGKRSACEDYGETVTTHGYNLWCNNNILGTTGWCWECAHGTIGSKFVGNYCENDVSFITGESGDIYVVGSDAQPTKDILVADNTLIGDATGTKATRLLVQAQGVVTITGNRIQSCANTLNTAAIVINTITTIATITNNQLTGCDGGIYFGAGAVAPAVIIGNQITAPSIACNMIDILGGAGFVISGNVLNGGATASKGIVLAATAGDKHIISNNSCASFTGECVLIGSDYNQVFGNVLQTTNVFGAIRLSAAHYNVVAENYCDANNAARTIYLDGSPTYNIIQENTLIGAAATVYESALWTAGATNVITPNNANAKIFPVSGVNLGAQTVGATEATIAHGLPWAPREIRVVMTSAGTVWKSKASTTTNIYLTADDAGRTCEVTVL
jgi:hypothetical protein